MKRSLFQVTLCILVLCLISFRSAQQLAKNEIQVLNGFENTIAFQTSFDYKEWKIQTLSPGKSLLVKLTDVKSPYYLRLCTNLKYENKTKCETYELSSNKRYIIVFNDQVNLFILKEVQPK